MIPQIDLARQHGALRAELVAAAERVLASCRFILARRSGGAERSWPRSAAPVTASVNSGTDALVLALEAVGVRPGDEVITPSFSFVASASAVADGARPPVFVDIDPGHVQPRPRAGGAGCDAPDARHRGRCTSTGSPPPWTRSPTSPARGLAVVEDAAQAVGAPMPAGRPVSWGDARPLSFYPTKNLAPAATAAWC